MISEPVKATFETLYRQCAGLPNAIYFSKLMASWLNGESVLPQRMGLSTPDFTRLMETYFPLSPWTEDAPSGITAPEGVGPEIEELVDLFLAHRAGKDDTEVRIATIMAAGCMANDHLWHDLGFWCRPDLSAMIKENFPTLFAKNVKNMKWKKFFYKQMCLDLDASYACKVPSCAECVDFRECYSSDDLDGEFDKSTIQPFDPPS